MLPDWTQSLHFDPPTWLTPLFLAPWVAMGWAFVLNEMFEEDARRGVVKTRARELGWLRFELGRTVLIAAAILAVVYLLDGATRLAQFEILYAIASASDPSDRALTLWAGLLTAVRVALDDRRCSPGASRSPGWSCRPARSASPAFGRSCAATGCGWR